MIGSTLSHYKILEELGRGGMGIVYKAEDTKLNRTVALKVLPNAVLGNAEDKARFFREAQAAAQLHHAHIATVFAIEEAIPSDAAPGTPESPFIAMEYIEGETLTDRIARGPLKLEEIIQIGTQVASALEAAHEKNIVHRDVKGGNVMVTKKGDAKVLDFGLAKTAQSTKLTQLGSTLGTMAYMSPEQARGEEVDYRTDIWALGAVLYEMITGRHAFPGDYEQAVVYSILNESPEPPTAIRTGVPMSLEWIVMKCLAKKREERYQSLADLMVDLAAVKKDSTRSGSGVAGTSHFSSASMQVGAAPVEGGSQRPVQPQSATDHSSVSTTDRRVSWRIDPGSMALFAGMLVVGIVIGLVFRGNSESPARPKRTFPLSIPGVSVIDEIAVSPQSAYIAVLAGATAGGATVQLFSTTDAKVYEIDRAGQFFDPTFSPDGRWFSYIRGTSVYKISVPDGVPVKIHDRSAVVRWEERGSFLYGDAYGSAHSENDGIWRSDADGRNSELLIKPNSSLGHRGLFVTSLLPDGRYALGVAVIEAQWDVIVLDLEDRDYSVLMQRVGWAEYVPSGHILYRADESVGAAIIAVPFEARKRQLTGAGFPLDLAADRRVAYAWGQKSGTFVWAPTESDGLELTWFSAKMETTGQIPIVAGIYSALSVSPDGRRVAVEYGSSSVSGTRIQLVDMSDGSVIQLSDAENSFDPQWSPDGKYVYYAGPRDGPSAIIRAEADGSGRTDTVFVPQSYSREPFPSPDGNWIAYLAPGETEAWNVFAVNLSTGETRTIVRSNVYLHDPAFSPDGRYIAYERTIGEGMFAAGQEVRVHEFEGNGDWPVSDTGPDVHFWDPLWSPDGKYLYFRSPTGLFRREVQLEPTFRPLGRVEAILSNTDAPFVISPTDGRIVVATPPTRGAEDAPDLYVVQGWFDELKRIAPADR